MRLPRQERKKARIEIIPMIDAIFFLLVFFMMTSLQMVQLQSRKVELPQSASAPARPSESNKIVVSISRQGELYVGPNQVREAQIVPLLVERVRKDPDVEVIINCDKGQRIGRFARIFDLVKQANPATVMIAASPKSPDQVPSK